MIVLANIVIAVVAILHLGFLALEMFFWNHPFGRKRFGMTPEYSQASASLAANQGLYNGFLAAGLVWALLAPAAYARELALFFLGCVLVAGLYGGATANRRIWLLQALPAALVLAVLFAT